MLDDEFMSILGASCQDALRVELGRATRKMGFETFTAFAVMDQPAGASEFFWVDNAPVGYGESAQYGDGRHDPVSQHCKTSSVPIVWDRRAYLTAGQSERWEYQAAYGYVSGIAVAFHLPQGRHFLLGVDRDQALPDDRAEVMRMAADLQLFAAYAQEAALRLLVPTAPGGLAVPLTARELECLRWTMDGKTAWEVGHILDISEQTAARHLCNATRKLDCTNKNHAVVKALRLGLIQ